MLCAIAVFFRILRVLSAVKKIQLLLLVAENATLEGRTLPCDFRCTRLDKLHCLADGNCSDCLRRLTIGASAIGDGCWTVRAGDLLLSGLLASDLLDLALDLLCLVDHGSELAAHYAVLQQHFWVVKVIVVTELAFKKIIIERVIESDPVQICLSSCPLKSSQRETNGTEALSFSADASQDNLERRRSTITTPFET